MTRFPSLPTLLTCLAAVGCGSENYQSRTTDNSVPFFQHQDELNANLGGRLGSGEISLRLPRTFTPVAAPRKKPGAPDERDPRLPPDFEGDLPGLVDAFKGTMRSGAESPGPAAKTVPVFAYLISSRTVPKDPEDTTASFDTIVYEAIARGLDQQPLPRQSREQAALRVGGEGFAPTLQFRQMVPFDVTIDGVPMQYRLFFNTGQSVSQGLPVALLFVLPKNPDRLEQMSGNGKRLNLSLETLLVRAKSDRPAAPVGGAAGGSGAPGF